MAPPAAHAPSLHELEGVCDYCGEVCDSTQDELNAINCTFETCPSPCIYHQHCVEAYLKSIRLDKQRKTGFSCPRGSGKASKYDKPCPGRVSKSHPIHARNENSKKRRKAKLPEPTPAPPPPPPAAAANGAGKKGAGAAKKGEKDKAVSEPKKASTTASSSSSSSTKSSHAGKTLGASSSSNSGTSVSSRANGVHSGSSSSSSSLRVTLASGGGSLSSTSGRRDSAVPRNGHGSSDSGSAHSGRSSSKDNVPMEIDGGGGETLMLLTAPRSAPSLADFVTAPSRRGGLASLSAISSTNNGTGSSSSPGKGGGVGSTSSAWGSARLRLSPSEGNGGHGGPSLSASSSASSLNGADSAIGGPGGSAKEPQRPPHPSEFLPLPGRHNSDSSATVSPVGGSHPRPLGFAAGQPTMAELLAASSSSSAPASSAREAAAEGAKAQGPSKAGSGAASNGRAVVVREPASSTIVSRTVPTTAAAAVASGVSSSASRGVAGAESAGGGIKSTNGVGAPGGGRISDKKVAIEGASGLGTNGAARAGGGGDMSAGAGLSAGVGTSVTSTTRGRGTLEVAANGGASAGSRGQASAAGLTVSRSGAVAGGLSGGSAMSGGSISGRAAAVASGTGPDAAGTGVFIAGLGIPASSQPSTTTATSTPGGAFPVPIAAVHPAVIPDASTLPATGHSAQPGSSATVYAHPLTSRGTGGGAGEGERENDTIVLQPWSEACMEVLRMRKMSIFVRQLQELGFPEGPAIDAVRIYGGDLHACLDHLLHSRSGWIDGLSTSPPIDVSPELSRLEAVVKDAAVPQAVLDAVMVVSVGDLEAALSLLLAVEQQLASMGGSSASLVLVDGTFRFVSGGTATPINGTTPSLSLPAGHNSRIAEYQENQNTTSVDSTAGGYSEGLQQQSSNQQTVTTTREQQESAATAFLVSPEADQLAESDWLPNQAQTMGSVDNGYHPLRAGAPWGAPVFPFPIPTPVRGNGSSAAGGSAISHSGGSPRQQEGERVTTGSFGGDFSYDSNGNGGSSDGQSGPSLFAGAELWGATGQASGLNSGGAVARGGQSWQTQPSFHYGENGGRGSSPYPSAETPAPSTGLFNGLWRDSGKMNNGQFDERAEETTPNESFSWYNSMGIGNGRAYENKVNGQGGGIGKGGGNGGVGGPFFRSGGQWQGGTQGVFSPQGHGQGAEKGEVEDEGPQAEDPLLSQLLSHLLV